MQYNLKDQDEYIEFFEEVIEDIDGINTFNEQGFPLNEDTNEPIDIDWLWENYGQHLDGTQTGLGYQVFGEIIDYYKPISEERRDEIKEMARQDFLDAYECGQLNEDDCDSKQLREMGLTTKQEQETYTKVYEELMYK